MSIINAILSFVPHKSVKIGILFQIIYINYYFMSSNQYNSYTVLYYRYVGITIYIYIYIVPK